MKIVISTLTLCAALASSALAAGQSKSPSPRPSPRLAVPIAAPRAPVSPRLDALSASVGKALDASLAPAASAEAAARFAGDGQTLLQGGVPGLSYGGAVAAAEPVLAEALDGELGYESFSLGFAARGAVPAAGERVPAPAPEEPRTVSSRFSYGARRLGLGLIARLWGVEASLPLADEALFAKVLDEAAGKRVVFMDFDRTLGPHAGEPTPGNAAALGALKRAGKQGVVISDRPVLDDGKNNRSLQLSLTNLPAEDLDGMIVAGKKDGLIVRYDGAKAPQVIHAEEGFTDAQTAAIREASAALLKRLPALGARQHDGGNGIPGESVSKYSFAIMLAPGTEEKKVLAAADALEAEIKSRGLDFEVEGRMAYDAGKPPYITFSKIDKSWAVRRVADLLKLEARDAVIVGDSMFTPAAARRRFLGGAAAALARWLSGRPAQQSGNATDADMEKGLPGALTIGVGGTASPRLRNGYAVLGTVDATQRVLQAAASRPAAPAKAPWHRHPAWNWVAIALLVAGGVLGWYMIFTMFSDFVMNAESALRSGGVDPFEGF